MTDARRPPPRELAVDALRAAALLPVVAVNWVGYASLPDAGPLGAAVPAASWWAQGSLIAVAVLLAAKGITLLTFLFGYGQGLSRRARGADAHAVRRRRMRRLLLLGVLHGALIYAGDILTLYAVCGLVMLGWSRLRLRQLRRRAIVLLSVSLVLMAVMSAGYKDPAPLSSLATPSSWPDWLALNARGYLTGLAAMLFLGFLMPLGVMTAGLLAARLRLFSHPRWRPALQRWAKRWLWPGLIVNLVWGLVLWEALRSGQGDWPAAIYAFGFYVAMPLLAGLVPAWVLAAQQGGAVVQRLAALGRHTLSLYVGSSLLSLAVFSGVGLALPLGTATLLVMAVLYWGVWLAVAPRWRGRLPLEAWLSR